MVELSANLYGSWGSSFKDVIKLAQHRAMLNFWLWIWQRAIEAEQTVMLETVVDEREATDVPKPHCFRLWVPLDSAGLTAFSTQCAGALPLWAEERNPKRPRMAPPPELGSKVLKTRADVLAALRAYGGGLSLADVSTSPSIPGEALPSHHIVVVLDATARLQKCQQAYCSGGVPAWQRHYTSYTTSPDNGRTHRLTFPPEAIAKGLVREINPGFLQHADDALAYHLPHLSPSEVQVEQVIRATAHATGCDDVHSDTDPTLYAQMTLNEDRDDNADAHDTLLAEVYPIIERVRRRNKSRIAQCGLDAVIGEIVRELDTLYSVKVTGVPTVYTALREERKRRLEVLAGKHEVNNVTKLARRMFWRKTNPNLTAWGSLMASLIGGICTAARMLPPQRKLWLLLFLRSHKCVANHTGSSAYIICCGPPETGKSKACAFWLSCMAIALQRMNDGESAKAHTAMDMDADMRVLFQDELQEHVSGENSGENAKQTLISNGVLKTKRLVKDEDGRFVLQETVSANRAMRVTCTNNINDVKDAIKSRATIVAVPALRTTETTVSASTLASIGRTEANALRDGFSLFCRALTSMQADFWALEAAGTLSVDDRMLLLYKVISDALAPEMTLSARKMVEIRHMACSIMVLDLGSRWYRLGEGARHGMTPAAQAAFYAKNAVIKMEHVVAAVGVSTASTSVDLELTAVQRTLRSLIRMDAMGFATMSADQTGYVLATTRRRLPDDVADANTALGPGLTKALLRSVQQGTTQGRPNIRFDVEDRQELVILDRNYAASFMADEDHAILETLREIVAQASPSWVGNYMVFKSTARHLVTDTSDTGPRKNVPALAKITQPALRLALAIFETRVVREGKKLVPAWRLHDSLAVARLTEADNVGAVDWADGTRRLKKVEQAVLAVHKSFFDNANDTPGGPRARIFQACLAVAGGYQRKRVVVSLGPNSRGAATVCPRLDTALVVRNPMYVDTNDVDMLLGEESMPDDAIFPRAKKMLNLSGASECEAMCFEERK